MNHHIDKKTLATCLSLIFCMVCLQGTAFADIADSTLGIGTKNLINDASTYLTFICPITGGAAAGYFAIRRSMADEQDGKFFEKRIKTAIFCGVGGCLVNAVIAVISSYY